MNFRSSKLGLLLGAINGFVFGVAFQPVSNAWLIYDNSRPSSVTICTTRGTTPLAEYLILILLFTLASYTAHRFLATKIKSDVVFWQVVAIIATVVPSTFFYFLNQFRYINGAVRAKLERGEWGYYPGLLPNQNDFEFGILFLCLAVTINFFYGVIVGEISKYFEK